MVQKKVCVHNIFFTVLWYKMNDLVEIENRKKSFIRWKRIGALNNLTLVYTAIRNAEMKVGNFRTDFLQINRAWRWFFIDWFFCSAKSPAFYEYLKSPTDTTVACYVSK